MEDSNCYDCIFSSGQNCNSDGTVCKINNADTFNLIPCFLFISTIEAIPFLIGKVMLQRKYNGMDKNKA